MLLYYGIQVFLEMGLRIKIDKIMLVLHIRNLKENTLAKQIYKEQKKLNWPGLAAESKAICLELDIEDCNSTTMNKCDYKKVVIRACHKKNEEKLRALGRGKCERIQIEDYGKKSYLQKKTRPGDLVGAGPNWVTFWSKFVLF